MNIFKDPKLRMILFVVFIAIACMIAVSMYSMYLLKGNQWIDEDYTSPGEQYDAELDYDLGIGGEGYENRKEYDQNQYDVDIEQVYKYICSGRYDLIADLMKNRLATYKFVDDKLNTITALSRMYIFDTGYESTQNERILLISSIREPLIYVKLFSMLSTDDQRMLITYNNINILPDFDYKDIVVTKKMSSPGNVAYGIIGSKEYYEVTLTYKSLTFVIYMIDNGNLEIFYINNAEHNMNAMKY
jgi:hypothetical protein